MDHWALKLSSLYSQFNQSLGGPRAFNFCTPPARSSSTACTQTSAHGRPCRRRHSSSGLSSVSYLDRSLSSLASFSLSLSRARLPSLLFVLFFSTCANYSPPPPPVDPSSTNHEHAPKVVSQNAQCANIENTFIVRIHPQRQNPPGSAPPPSSGIPPLHMSGR